MLSLNSLVYQTVAENKTKYSRCLHFSIQNMEQSRDLIRALDGLTLTSTDAWYDVFCGYHRIGLALGVISVHFGVFY